MGNSPSSDPHPHTHRRHGCANQNPLSTVGGRIHRVIRYGLYDDARVHLEEHPDADIDQFSDELDPEARDLTALQIAIRFGKTRMALLLIESERADPNKFAIGTLPPLTEALFTENYVVIVRLLRAGANPNRAVMVTQPNLDCNRIMDPMAMAIVTAMPDFIIGELVRHGATLHSPEHRVYDTSLFDHISRIEHTPPLNELFRSMTPNQFKLEINRVYRCGEFERTPLMDAIIRRRWNYAHNLLMHGADPNIPDNQGDTPLGRTVQLRNLLPTHLIVSLLAHGANPNAQTRQWEDGVGRSLIEQALIMTRYTMVDLLLEWGAHVPHSIRTLSVGPILRGGFPYAAHALITHDNRENVVANTDEWGSTAIMDALYVDSQSHDRVTTLAVLLRAGAVPLADIDDDDNFIDMSAEWVHLLEHAGTHMETVYAPVVRAHVRDAIAPAMADVLSKQAGAVRYFVDIVSEALYNVRTEGGDVARMQRKAKERGPVLPAAAAAAAAVLHEDDDEEDEEDEQKRRVSEPDSKRRRVGGAVHMPSATIKAAERNRRLDAITRAMGPKRIQHGVRPDEFRHALDLATRGQ